MPAVDFYILESSSEQARLSLACKLVAKAYTANQRVYVQCADQTSAETFDALLWSFDDISFIPHGLTESQTTDDTPIMIGWQASTRNNADILLNLHPNIPDNTEHFERILEIVSADPDCKKICREHYKAYQAQDFPLKSHHV